MPDTPRPRPSTVVTPGGGTPTTPNEDPRPVTPPPTTPTTPTPAPRPTP